MDESNWEACCNHCYLARLIVKSAIIGLTVGFIWVAAIIGIIAVVSGAV